MTCERVTFWCLTSVELTKRDANQWVVRVSINKVNIGVDIGAAAAAIVVVANVLWSHVGNIAKCSCSEINYSNLNWKSMLYAQSIFRLISRVSGVVQNVVYWARAMNSEQAMTCIHPRQSPIDEGSEQLKWAYIVLVGGRWCVSILNVAK